MGKEEERLKITGFGVATVGPRGEIIGVALFNNPEEGNGHANMNGRVRCIVELTFRKDCGVKTIK